MYENIANWSLLDAFLQGIRSVVSEIWINFSKIFSTNIIFLLAYSPRRSMGIRVASGFEFSVCLFVCLSVLCKFSHIISYDNIIWFWCHVIWCGVLWYHMIKFSNIIISYHVVSYHIISYYEWAPKPAPATC